MSCLWLAACGSVSPDPPSQPGSLQCPTIPTSFGQCSEIHLLRTSLTCGGDGKVSFGTSKSPGGASRFTLQFMNGSRFQGTLITPDPGCVITDGTDADFTFGLVYTADQGAETDGSPCVIQSKTDYSSFNFDLLGMAPHEGMVKARLHEVFDKELIAQVFGSTFGGKPLVGRCQRWRQMP